MDYRYLEYLHRLEIKERREREKWLKFEYPEDVDIQYDPADGDTRGDYKEIDKNRKKTWHSKGGIPYRGYSNGQGCPLPKFYRRKENRRIRSCSRRRIQSMLKSPKTAEKYHTQSNRQASLKTCF